MRKFVLTALLLLMFCSSAWAYEWSLQVRGFGGAVYPHSEEWDELYDGAVLPSGGVSVDAEFAYGLGPYLAFNWGHATQVIENRIDVDFYNSDLILGLQWRFYPLPWLAPAVRLGPMVTLNREVIADDDFKHEMEHAGFGWEAALESNFYPFYWANSAALRGFGAYLALVYQRRPLENMGDLTNASGVGVMAGLQFKWDFGRQRETAPAPEIQIAPPENSGMERSEP